MELPTAQWDLEATGKTPKILFPTTEVLENKNKRITANRIKCTCIHFIAIASAHSVLVLPKDLARETKAFFLSI